MNVSQVAVILAVTATTIAGTIIHIQPPTTDDPEPPTATILTTREASDHITLQTTQNNTFQLTCQPPDDARIDKLLWRPFPVDAPAPLGDYPTYWNIERNHTQTIPHDDEARFPQTGEYYIDAVCETWNFWDDARWVVHIDR